MKKKPADTMPVVLVPAQTSARLLRRFPGRLVWVDRTSFRCAVVGKVLFLGDAYCTPEDSRGSYVKAQREPFGRRSRWYLRWRVTPPKLKFVKANPL